MSKNYLNVVLLCSEKIGQKRSIESLLDSIQNIGYEISSPRVGDIVTEQFAFWRHYNEQTRHELNIAYEKQHLTFEAVEKKVNGGIILTFNMRWNTDKGEPSGGIAWPWHRWQVKDSGCTSILEAHSQDTAMFTQRQWDPEANAERLLVLVRLIYNVIQPQFAWIERCHWKGYTTPKDVFQLRLPHLYWANFFSPAYVKKLGKEYLLNAPGWKKELLADGGLLYVLTPSLMGTGPRETVSAVREYFDVPSVRRNIQ